jgi:hypothetical protein
MDSKVINKLIRSEVWPLLRDQGFSKFESRTALRYRGPFINVVSFQSFNAYLAEGIGCTTFSFALNLGVYVIGSAHERFIKRDKGGLLLPREYHCPFRVHLNKRTPVDGFARGDIFYIDPAGYSTAACFREARHLLTEVAPRWFEPLNDLDGLVAWTESGADVPPDLPTGAPLDSPIIFRGHDLFATLQLLKHKDPSTG